MDSSISPRLRGLVSISVALLGQVVKRQLGPAVFDQVETIRSEMAGLRGVDAETAYRQIEKTYSELEKMDGVTRLGVAHSYTFMLELMNVCEAAYRTDRLRRKTSSPAPEGEGPEAVIYVLTAHPTEARAPQNIAVFHEIQDVLIRILSETPESESVRFKEKDRQELFHHLELAWRTPVVRDRAPKVRDEAEHIYANSLQEKVLLSWLESAGPTAVPFYLRSWVGGDKDGHPGVDETTLLESLELARARLLSLVTGQLKRVRAMLDLLAKAPAIEKLAGRISKLEGELRALRRISNTDAKGLIRIRKNLRSLVADYEREFGAIPPELTRVRRIFQVFPGLVVPLEIRESSDVLKEKVGPKGPRPAIDRMLHLVAKISKGGEPRWYVRGFIISMTRGLDDIKAAADKSKAAFGALKLPIVPLFEEAESLADSERIVTEMLADPDIRRAASENWDGLIELMVGYSDSSKEAGVLASRLAIAKTLPKLERVCKQSMLQAVFFHGSGGSIDRGGGSIEDQTAWWPRSALRRYKVTVQGEMVERSFSTPEILRSQLEHIARSVSRGLKVREGFVEIPALESFADAISKSYRQQVGSAKFLDLIQKATPYSYLTDLKIGSRPAKRAKTVSVSGVRAIPWILCWTQTRILFPTWWGVGSAWADLSGEDREELKRAFRREPVFTSYVKALGFTLAKIELPVFRMYLEKSELGSKRAGEAYAEFAAEFVKTNEFFTELTGQRDRLWFRPWLGESVQLRSPMIHPLNCLQILAQKTNDTHLLRVCVTGISSGMMTTG